MNVDDLAPLQVDDDRPVCPPFAPTPVVDAGDADRCRDASGGVTLQVSQDGVVAGRDSKARRQQLARTTAGGVAEQSQEFGDAAGSACHRRCSVGKAFHEGRPLALTIAAPPAAQTEFQRDLQALGR